MLKPFDIIQITHEKNLKAAKLIFKKLSEKKKKP